MPLVRALTTMGIVGMLGLFIFWFFGPRSASTWWFFMMALTVTYVSFVYILFFETYLSVTSAPDPGETNLAAFLDYPALTLFAIFRGQGSSGLLVPLLAIPGMQTVLMRMGVQSHDFEHALKSYLESCAETTVDEHGDTLIRACLDDRRERHLPLLLSWRDICLGLYDHSIFFKQFIFDQHLEKEELRSLLAWQEQDENRHERYQKFWRRENLLRTRGIGRTWAAGYTPNLQLYATEMNRSINRQEFSPRLFGRQKETEHIERILIRDGKNNALVVGEDGVGKTTIVSALAERIAVGQVAAPIAHKRILSLDIEAIVAGATQEHGIEGRLKIILNEAARAGNVILLIEDIHALFDDSRAVGTINAMQVLLPYLSSSSFQVIGLTTHEGYHNTIAKQPSLLRVFEEVDIREPTKEDVYPILHDVIPHIEAHAGVFILYQAVKAAVEMSDRYIKNVPFPEKAIDILQEAAVYAQTNAKTSVVQASHVEEVVHRKTDIPVGDMALEERDTLLHLETALHARVVGQDEAIAAIANAMRRSRSGIASEKKPIGSFLFLGPTGVGKTETAKALAAIYFGSEKRMIRFDMSEYQESDSLDRLIGRDTEVGLLTTAITDNPFSLILLDEIEKAHPNILNLFLQVFDDGRLTDTLGRTVDFTNALIIATSNAGDEMIRESIGVTPKETLQEKVLEYLQTTGVFRPEFINRFDAIIMFRPLTSDQVEQIVGLMLTDLNRRLKDKGIAVAATAEVQRKIAAIGFNQEFGARPLRRAIQDKVENLIAMKLLSGEMKRGDTLSLTPNDL